MAKSQKNTGPVKVTNPRAATPLPSSRGSFNPAVAPVDPVRPNAANGSTLLRPGSRVIVTSKASDLRMPSVTPDNKIED